MVSIRDLSILVAIFENPHQGHDIFAGPAMIGHIVNQFSHQMNAQFSDLPVGKGQRRIGLFHALRVEWNTIVGDGHGEAVAGPFHSDFDIMVAVIGVCVRNYVAQ